MSERWFGLDWRNHLPWRIGTVEVSMARFSDALPELTRIQTGLGLTADDRFGHDAMTPAKRRFYDDSDLFMLTERGEAIGFVLAQPSDWSTYYMRFVGLLPSHRGRGLVGEVTARIEAVLAEAGVERIEGDIPPPNLPNLMAQTRLGFVASGMLNHDRWGSMLRVTKHLAPKADDVFRRQFFAGSWPRARSVPFTERAGKEPPP